MGARAHKPGWRAHAHAILEREGFRAGAARGRVVDALARQDCCATAPGDRRRAAGGRRPRRLASVYRALEVLDRLGLVHRLDVGDSTRATRRRLGGSTTTTSSATSAAASPSSPTTASTAIATLSQRLDFAINQHDVVLRGSCPNCRSRASSGFSSCVPPPSFGCPKVEAAMDQHVSWIIEVALKDGALNAYTAWRRWSRAPAPTADALRAVHLGRRPPCPHLREVRDLRVDGQPRQRVPEKWAPRFLTCVDVTRFVVYGDPTRKRVHCWKASARCTSGLGASRASSSPDGASACTADRRVSPTRRT